MRVRVLGAHNLETGRARHTCFLIDGVLAIDAGSLVSSLSLVEQGEIRALLITHQHFDHARDIPTLGLTTMGSPEPIHVYGHPVPLSRWPRTRQPFAANAPPLKREGRFPRSACATALAVLLPPFSLEVGAMANQLGKRYECQVCGTTVLCTKAGEDGAATPQTSLLRLASRVRWWWQFPTRTRPIGYLKSALQSVHPEGAWLEILSGMRTPPGSRSTGTWCWPGWSGRDIRASASDGPG